MGSRYCQKGGDIILDSPDSKVSEMGDKLPTDMSFTHNMGRVAKTDRGGEAGCGTGT